VRQRPAGGAPGDDPIQDDEGLVVEGDHAFGAEFAQRHLQPGAVPGDLVHAVQLEVAQLTQAQPGGAGEQQRVGVQPGQRVGPGRGQLFQRGGQPAVGVRWEVAGQRVRGVGDVPDEQQRPGRGGGPAPFGDVGEELADGEDLPAPVPDRVRPPVRMPGGGQRGQPGFDVCAPVQRGQVGGRWVAGRQEPAEPGQVAGDRLDRGRGAGGGGLGAVVEQQPAQRFGDAAVVPVQAGAAPRIGRWVGEDAEVEQHPVRRGDQAAVVGPAAGVALRLGAAAERRGQLLDVRAGERGQRPPGLDQQPRHDAFRGALDDVSAVVQVGGRGGEPRDIGRERAAPGGGEQPTDLAVGEVVIARSAAAVQHQEGQEWPLRTRQLQLRGQGFAGEPGRVRPAAQERPGRVAVAA
jgi:hypothetical protein